MAILYENTSVQAGFVGDGGNVGADQYLEMTLGQPHPLYTLPENIVVKGVVAKSLTNNQTVTVEAIDENTGKVYEIISETDFSTGKKETYYPNFYIDAITVVASSNASSPIKVTVIFQKIII